MRNLAYFRRRWEERQSWYLVLLLTPWTYWIPLVYTGLRTWQGGWVLCGLFYGLPVFVHFGLNPTEYGLTKYFKYWEVGAWLAAIIHSIAARSEFVELLADSGATMEVTEVVHENVEQALAREQATETAGEVAFDAAPDPAPPQKPVKSGRGRMLLDINTAVEEELAMLPGLNEHRARQIVAMRALLGRYETFDQFADRNSMDHGLREKLRPMFLNSEPPGKTIGRVVEAGESNASEPGVQSKSSRQRIVDL